MVGSGHGRFGQNMLVRLGRVAGAVALIFAFVVLTDVAGASASQSSCKPPNGTYDPVLKEYRCKITGTPGTPADPGDGGASGGSDGTSQPTCDLEGLNISYEDKNPTPPFCQGGSACYTTDVFPPLRMPEGDPPNEDSKARVTWCSADFVGGFLPARIF